MNQLFFFENSVKRDPAIDLRMKQHAGELGEIARHWFEAIRHCGNDVRELMHDGYATACVSTAAFVFSKRMLMLVFSGVLNCRIPQACYKAQANTCGM